MTGPCPTRTGGTIFAVKRYAIHDGPNLRTCVFLKGCPLRCAWCHNPEGMDHPAVMVSMPERCVGCGACIAACPGNALRITASGPARDHAACSLCTTCEQVCPALAHEATGKEQSVAQVLEAIEKDRPFYDCSEGGVTFSGGEPLAQPGFLLELLRACGRRGIHRAVDTCAYAETSLLLHIAKETDLFLIDIKHMDDAAHRRFTGVSNRRILANISTLAEYGHPLRLRLPLIPGINDDDANLRATGAFIAALPERTHNATPGTRSVDVLPYHSAAKAKYAKLGKAYPGADIPPSDPQRVRHAVEILRQFGLTVHTGG